MAVTLPIYIFALGTYLRFVSAIRELPGLPEVIYKKKGDINLAGVIPVHRYDKNDFCSENIRELGALQRVEALAFALEEINQRTDLLPNVTLGFTILDDCSKDTTALTRALHFIQSSPDSSSPTSSNHLLMVDTAGIIGSESSKNSVQMADLLSLFEIPQLSYISTSPLLSDKYTYKYFSRIVPPDTYQAQAMVDLMGTFNWTYFSVIYSEGSYGTEGYKALKDTAERAGICLAATFELKQYFTDGDYDSAIDAIREFPRAKVVVLFSPLSDANYILSAAQRKNCEGEFTWIGSDAWGRNLQDYNGMESVSQGAITIKLHSDTVQRFDDYFRSLGPSSATGNPWFREFWENHFQCDLNNDSLPSSTLCDKSATFNSSGDYAPESTVSLLMDAVYAYGFGIDTLIRDLCPEANSSTIKSCLSGGKILTYLRNVTDAQGDPLFDQNGDGFVKYELQNFQYVDGQYRLSCIGLWDRATQTVKFTGSKVVWNSLILDNEAGEINPKSTCSDECPAGYQQVLESVKCCWECEKCRENEITVLENNLRNCKACKNFTWPDDVTRTVCEIIPPSYLTWSNAGGIGLAVVAIVGIAMTTSIGAIFVKHREERLIKASSRETMCIIFVGVLLSFLVVFAFLAAPSDASCQLSFLGFHLSFTLTYGPLTVKTNRIYRIFAGGKKSTKRPRFTESKFQMIFIGVLFLIQMLVLVVSMIVDMPSAIIWMPSVSEKYVELTCDFPIGTFTGPLAFNFTVVLVCTFYAVKTRKLPDNYNESKFISFCVYTTLVMWLAFMPSYFLTTKTFFRTIYLTVAMIANASVTLMFIYCPKLYALFNVDSDHLNLRTAGKTNLVGGVREFTTQTGPQPTLSPISKITPGSD